VAGVLSATGAAGNSAGYDDRVGEVTEGADISRIEVSNDDSGNVTFRILLANRPTGLVATDRIVVFVDTDENPATGGSLLGVSGTGFEYVLDVGPPWGAAPHGCDVWTRAEVAPPAPGSLKCSVGQEVTFRITRADLGATEGINLQAASYVFDPAVNGVGRLHDLAPDCGAWNYKISSSQSPPGEDPCATPPPPPPPPPPRAAEHATATLTPTHTSASVSVAVEDPIVTVTATASHAVRGFNLTSFKNVAGARTSTGIARLKVTKRATRLKVTARVTGVQPGELGFKVKARHVPKKTRVRVTVKQQNA
jgi:hypothetical protein